SLECLAIGLYLALLAILGAYGFHRIQLLYLYLRYRKIKPQPIGRFDELPRVTIQLPIYNEMYVVDRLLESIARIDYPKNKLDIQVLDDSTDETQIIARAKVEELKKQGFDIAYVHRKQRKGFKAGALQAGLQSAKGDFILIFDADFVPQPSIVKELIHYFTDPQVGMVQARWGHLNQSYSLLTQVQSMMLDGHFIIEHIGRNRSGRFFNFNGTGGMWRKSAILDAGGWQDDTLTEDMDLSFRAQMRGWKFIYVPDIVTPAELPCEINAFKGQQFRWAKGSAQTTKKLFWQVIKAKIPLKVKIELIFHMTNNFAYVFLLVLAVLQLPNMWLRHYFESPKLVWFDLPLFMLTSASIAAFYLVAHHAIYGRILEAFWKLPMMMAVGIGLSLNNARAVIEGLFGPHGEFVRTPKHGITSRNHSWKNKKYKTSHQAYSWIEIILGVYFLATILIAIAIGAWSTVPFLLLFMVGFLYVGFTSLIHSSQSVEQTNVTGQNGQLLCAKA
ncbi:MAG: glycosyltransferase family 2 protein, partial [Sandaracinaceae bacterium]|nr:glycosyltransferase family 2 protein [Sandaracinaceae bacterium]